MELIDKMNGVLDDLSLKARCVAAEQNGHLAFFDLQTSRVSAIESFSREIAMGLRSKKSPIITTIPRLGIVRLRVAMGDAEVIPFDDIYNNSTPIKGTLPFLFGRDDEGNPLWVDMAKNPHMLIAGTTGSGKSTLLHVIIANALKRHDVELTLIDPKFGVEFARYSDTIHVAKEYSDALAELELIQSEMEYRYRLMFKNKVFSIDQDPNIFKKKLVVIDEIADLLLKDNSKSNPEKGKFEDILCNIAQKARACGIYMVIATQRPSIDIITGSIKANFPARVACKVSTATDSKVILDQVGAESLLGRGDAIINSVTHNYIRFQSAYVG